MASHAVRRARQEPPLPSMFTNLDELLLDIAIAIELSPTDRRIANNRYQLVQEFVERPSSPIRRYLITDESRIYAQGSIATSTTVLSGDQDDRFDVDAIVEMHVPEEWQPNEPLNRLFDALKNFPRITGIERCTRCVQLAFPSMHMDIAVMDRRNPPAIDRAGSIFHSPDEGESYRVPSNPWGFSAWFRDTLAHDSDALADSITALRRANSVSKITVLDESERLSIHADADLVPLPTKVPPQIDAPQAVSLKLLKRYLNLRYRRPAAKKPPSIWLTKIAAERPRASHGLAHQLVDLAGELSRQMSWHLKYGSRPNDKNPTYSADKLNDRWPTSIDDMATLRDQLDFLNEEIQNLLHDDLADAYKRLNSLFGERPTGEAKVTRLARKEHQLSSGAGRVEPRIGTILGSVPATVPAETRPIPPHRFHPDALKK